VDRNARQKIASTGKPVAVITGASSGIGRALTLALSRQGLNVRALGRNSAGLAETVAAAAQFSEVSSYHIDLTVDDDVRAFRGHLEALGRLDILIHSAGAIRENPLETASIEDLDHQYRINVRAAYLLTQQLLPLLSASHGQIVFINSSAGVTAKRPESGQYAATKHALRAIADSLREEVNPQGVRVLSVYLGRTATPMQEALFRKEGQSYDPDILLQPEDVASTIVHALMLPRTAEVTDISIRPMRKS